MARWLNRPAPVVVRDTGWVPVQTAASGLAAQGPMDPIQGFRVRRIDNQGLVDLTGLRLDQTKQGLANLGTLPRWMRPVIQNQFYWVNHNPISLTASVVSTFGSTGVIYFNHQLINGQLGVNRPETLHGGFEFTTDQPFPKEYL